MGRRETPTIRGKRDKKDFGRLAINAYDAPQHEPCAERRCNTDTFHPVSSDVPIHRSRGRQLFSQFWDVVFSSIIDLDGNIGEHRSTDKACGDPCAAPSKNAVAKSVLSAAAPGKDGQPYPRYVYDNPVPCWYGHGNHDVVIYYTVRHDKQEEQEICRARLSTARTRVWVRRLMGWKMRRPQFKTKNKIPLEYGSGSASEVTQQPPPELSYRILRPA